MKKIISGLLVSAAVLGFAVNVNATENVTTVEGSKDINSKATITVTEGSEKTDPVEPNEPDGKTDQAGPLSIDNVIVFAFEDMQLSGTTQRIPLKASTEQNVQVTDSRGTGNGWNLQVKQSELVNTADSTKKLKGAYITLNNATVNSSTNNADGSEANAPTAAGTALALNTNDFIRIMNADENKGMGTWYEKFINNETAKGVELVVPSGSYKGDYEGTVTWRLSDGPNVTAPQAADVVTP